jgi:hypothetical protein
VLNQLSAVWSDLPAAAELIDQLLVDRRGGRRGFPADVLAELLTVRRIAVKRMVRQPLKTPKAPGHAGSTADGPAHRGQADDDAGLQDD